MSRLTRTLLNFLPGWMTGADDQLMPVLDNVTDLGGPANQIRDGYFGRNVLVNGVPIVGGGTGLVGGEGSIPFFDADGHLTEDNAELAWDKDLKALGIGGAPTTEKVRVLAETGKLGLNVDADNASAIVGTSQTGSGIAGASVGDRGLDGTSAQGPSVYAQSSDAANASPTLMAVRADAAAAADLFAATDEGQNPLLSISKSGAVVGVVQTDPAAPAAGQGTLYFKDVGGKVALMVRFPTGSAIQVAIEA
jgi:hypothetical protein